MEENKKYEMVNHPKHYNIYDVEAVEMIAKIYGRGFMINFCEATALLYRLRMGLKPGNSIEQELDKEKWWLEKRDYYKRMSIN